MAKPKVMHQIRSIHTARRTSGHSPLVSRSKHRPQSSPIPLPSLTKRRHKHLNSIDSPSDLRCPHCGKQFLHSSALLAHTTQKSDCRRTMKSKAPALVIDVEESTPGVAEEVSEGEQTDESYQSPDNSTKKRKRDRSSVGTGREEALAGPGVEKEHDVEEQGFILEEGEEDGVYMEEPGDIYEDQAEELFLFVPTPPTRQQVVQPDEATSSSVTLDNSTVAGPSETSQREDQHTHRSHPTAYQLDDDEDQRVVEESVNGGKKIRASEGLYERWRKHFETLEGERLDKERRRAQNRASEDGENVDDVGGINSWAPFASRLDWEIAKWAVEDGIGNGQLNRLLEIPGVRLYSTSIHISVLADTQIVTIGRRESWALFS